MRRRGNHSQDDGGINHRGGRRVLGEGDRFEVIEGGDDLPLLKRERERDKFQLEIRGNKISRQGKRKV